MPDSALLCKLQYKKEPNNEWTVTGVSERDSGFLCEHFSPSTESFPGAPSPETICVPSSYEGLPVTVIGPKAFLSRKSIRTLILSESIRETGPWAFAHMHGLTRAEFRGCTPSFGKQAFLDCPSLTQILLTDSEGNALSEDAEIISRLFALSVLYLSGPGLLDLREAFEPATYPLWLSKFDISLKRFLEAPDEEGFEPVFYGWFNDEDASMQLPGHLKKRRREKAVLALTRLFAPNIPSFATNYIRTALSGAVSTPLSDYLCKECFSQVALFKQLNEVGILSADICVFLTKELGDRCAETTSYLLSLSESSSARTDAFFDSLSL